MTDRELLEYAAKAAGIELLWTCGGQPVNVPTLFKGLSSDEVWNPLADDGDEARLEAALGLHILWGSKKVIIGRTHFSPCEEYYQDHNGDKQAARRRAGVRIAAEIGKSMGSS